MKTKRLFSKIFTFVMILSIASLVSISCEEEKPPIDISYGTMYDIEGHSYKTVKINDTEWMAENLRTTKYASNTPISNPGADTNAWRENTNGTYSVYNNNEAYESNYGLLYNAHAVFSSSGLCPTE